jgi:hypothetical protein
MERRDLIIIVVVGAVLAIVYWRTNVQLAVAQNDAAKIAAGNALVGQGVAAVRAYYGV